ncbi:MAG TPA: glycosyltransferase [Burkholderiales bacterium]|nr:glycosyltransferase [Burkholderiales bacterium]
MSTDAPSGLSVVHAATHEHTGAGTSALRIHRAVAKAGLRSQMLVLEGTGAAPDVEVVLAPGRRRPLDLKLRAERVLLRLERSAEPGYRSLGLVRGPGLAALRRRRDDVVHLHWIPGLLGVADVAAIDAPLVWTFHDQWPICGAEHYTASARPREGYTAQNRLPGSGGFDLDRWTWERKRALWKDLAPVIVCPSRWLAAEVRASRLFGHCDVHVVPYPIDTARYRPQDRAAARASLGLPAERRLMAFGAWEALRDRRKGWHVLEQALRLLAARGLGGAADLVVFGAEGGGRVHGVETHWPGFIRDPDRMRTLLAACDLLVVPSLQDNLPNTILEAMACGTPVVGAQTGGIPDLVVHGETGLLAAAGDSAQLADRLATLLADDALRERFGRAARERIERECSEAAVGARYASLYRDAIAAGAARRAIATR